MEKVEEKPVNLLREWLDNMPTKKYNIVRVRIIKECRITPQIFRHWKCGTTRVPELAKEKINEIAGYGLFKIN